MVNHFTLANAREDCIFFIEAVGRDKNGDVPADRFFGGESEDALGSAVPTRDRAVEIFADDGVVREFDDDGKPVSKLRFAFFGS